MSDDDCPSYQSGDPRKYEFQTSPTLGIEEALDETLDALITDNPRSMRLKEIITNLHSEKSECEYKIIEFNTKEMHTEYTLRAFYTRVAHLEVENEKLEEENKTIKAENTKLIAEKEQMQIVPRLICALVIGVLICIIDKLMLNYFV